MSEYKGGPKNILEALKFSFSNFFTPKGDDGLKEVGGGNVLRRHNQGKGGYTPLKEAYEEAVSDKKKLRDK